jgi:hypothetical protein
MMAACESTLVPKTNSNPGKLTFLNIIERDKTIKALKYMDWIIFDRITCDTGIKYKFIRE